MYLNKSIVTAISIFFAVNMLSACSEQVSLPEASIETSSETKSESQAVILEVYKSPTCGCCEKWINHIDSHGFSSKVHSDNDFADIKLEKGIASQYRSCHTAVSQEGYVFEGHVPAKFIHQFLGQNHADNVIGLSVPAMPLGTPGMEMGDKFQPYRVLLLKTDGSYEIYAKVHRYEEQF